MKPQLIVFDLDYTLWPFWVDTHISHPCRMSGSKVVDARGVEVKYYPEVPLVLRSLYTRGYRLGIASRTNEIEGAKQLVDLFGWTKYFTYRAIYPGCKVKHFQQFKNESGFGFDEMLFFDDERRNISDLSNIGVTSILVSSGVDQRIVDKGLKQFASDHSSL